MNLHLAGKMSRRKQAKPNRLNEEEEEEQRAGLFNGRAKIARMEGEKADYECEHDEEGSGGEEGNNNHPGQLKEKLLALSLGSLPPLLPLDPDDVSPRAALAGVGRTIAQLTAAVASVASPGSLQELSVLQASLLSLQQQQLRQFRLLATLQQQEGGEVAAIAEKLGISNPFVAQLEEKQLERQHDASPPRSPGPASPPRGAVLEPAPRCIDSFSSTIITHHEPMQDQPVNTLELLQQKSASILQSASMGVLANNLADLSATPYPGAGPGREEEQRTKHKCRYCGKVFGSDSALGIHIRSHTGERPYKCNICGNRFTTKGNLKVHFQRHSDRFPVIKMNPNMVLEHLDKFYPALLQQCEEAEKKGQPMPDMGNPMAGMAPVVPPGMTLPPNLQGSTPPLSPSPAPRPIMKKAPQPPTTPKMPLTMGALPRYPCLPTVPIKREEIMKERPSWLKGFPLLDRPPLERSFDTDLKPGPNGGFLFKHEIKLEREPFELLLPRYPLPRFHIQQQLAGLRPVSPRSLGTPPGGLPGDQEDGHRLKMSEVSSEDGSFQDEPENLSSGKREAEEEEEEDGEGLLRRLRQEAGLPERPFLPTDPAKDPNIYNVLLPRPGSTDNSWENLIEVDKSNEAAKLESLVNGMDPTQSDPNECILCRRVLSCKSALQMHYRIHTGERPFKCKICNRTFTTKGNLKTHMGVHRSKPPMRSFPQCPVCHKKYANSVVLQQHIKTHTGEKTEMSLEQISAAEIRDFLPGDAASIPLGLPTIRPPGDPLNKFLPQFPGPPCPRPGPGEEEPEERLSRPSSVSSSASMGSSLATSGTLAFPAYCTSFSASLAALERQVRTMEDRPSPSRGATPEPEEPQDLSQGRASPREEPEEEERRADTSRSSGDGSSPLLGGRPLPLLPGLPPLGFPHHLFPGGLPPLPFPGLPGLPLLPGPPPPAFPLGLAFPPGRHPLMEDIFAARGKTTCQICFKVFACNSALEIHMRSHTKERPFKCDVCGKGFTTKGNMRQHQMTHKFSRDAGKESEEPALTSESPAGSEEPGPAAGPEEPSPAAGPGEPQSSPPSLASPPSSETLSPPYRGEKRPGEEASGLQPEKRAILCG